WRFAVMISRSVSRPKKSTASVSESSNGTSPLYGEDGSRSLLTSQPAVGRRRAPAGRARYASHLGRGRGGGHAPPHLFDVHAEVGVEHLEPALAPEAKLDRVGSKLHRPGLVVPALVAPQPAQEHAQVPVAQAVAEEEQVTRPQDGRDPNGEEAQR